jgi:acyl-CoA synthetase (AMP-forming)/AMP-acid ligase II
MWIFNVHGQSVPPTLKSWSELLSHGEDDWIRFDDKQVSRRTPVALLFSSGTTGLPKAAVLSHYNLVAQHTLAVEPQRVPYEVSKSTEAAPLEDSD